MVNVPISLNNLKTKVDDLDADTLTVMVDLQKWSDVVDNEAVKNEKINSPRQEYLV